jgi:signal transduction histidine kinase
LLPVVDSNSVPEDQPSRVRGSLVALWGRIEAWAIPRPLLEDVDQARRARLVVACAVVSSVGALVVSVGRVLRGTYLAAGILVGVSLLFGALPWILRRSGRVEPAAHGVAGAWLVLLTAGIYVRGGMGGPPAMALAAVPFLALLLLGTRGGIAWAAIATLDLVGCYIAIKVGGDFTDRLPPASRTDVNALAALVFVVVLSVLAVVGERRRTEALRVIKQRSDELLVAERARIEAETEKQLLRAEHLASLGQLAAGAAHEINNPLAYIHGNLLLLKEQLDEQGSLPSDDLREALEDSLAGAEQIRRIVRELKTYTRGEEEEIEDVELGDVIDAALKMADAELRHRARVERDYAGVAAVKANRTRLLQVFLNLVINAAQALDERSKETNTISIVARPRGDRVVIEVADSGCGMTPDVLSRVTEPFFTTKPVGVGTGLGLSVAHNLITRFGGALEVASTPGAGTRVTVTLRAAAKPARAEPQPPVDAQPPVEDGGSTRPARILVVDDDAAVARVVSRLLAKHQVTVVDSGRKCIDLLAHEPDFDLVLCDLMMPDGGGVEVYEALEASRSPMVGRIVFMSGGAFSDRARDFLDRIDNPVVDKPLSREVLNALVTSALETSGRAARSTLGEPDLARGVSAAEP